MRAGLAWIAMIAGSGCWSADPLIDGVFTQDQWTKLQDLRLPPAPLPCSVTRLSNNACTEGLPLAKQLFVDRRLSGNGTVSCESCHDAETAWADVRSPNEVSLGALSWTKRNSMSLLNIGYKELFAPGRPVFTWRGEFTTAGQVLELALPKAMDSTSDALGDLIRNTPAYADSFRLAFGVLPERNETLFTLVEQLFDGYLAEFPTRETPFDYYLDGDTSALSDSQKRGFAVFAGRGGCIECHSGPLFSDLQFHNTGVLQDDAKLALDHVPAADRGREDVSNDSADAGKFLTGSLREIASTAPYMHDGAYSNLHDVIAFYRRGGDAGQFPDHRDPRIVPLDLTDDDAADLEEFLHALSECTAATCPDHHPPQDAGVADGPIDAQMIDAPGPNSDAPPPMCPPPFSPCGQPAACVNEMMDHENCGACGRACFSYQVCNAGTCM